MAELVLERIAMRNWVRFKSAVVDFPKCGLVMVTGQNLASGGKLQSVGSGKTALGEAIGRAVLGVAGRFTHVKECSTNEAGDTYVKVDLRFKDKPLTVEMGYRCQEMSPTGEALRFHYDGRTVERGLIPETRMELDRLLGTDSLLASWTLFLDGDLLKFDRMPQAERVELVMAALRQPPWGAYHEKSKLAVLNLKKSMSGEQGVLRAARAQVEQANDNVYSAQATLNAARRKLAEAREKSGRETERLRAEADGKRALIEKCDGRRNAIADEIARLTGTKTAATAELKTQLEAIKKRLRELEVAKNLIQADVYKVKERLTLAMNSHRVLESVPEVCPTCRKPWDKKVDPARFQASRQELDEAGLAHEQTVARMDAATADWRRLCRNEDALRGEIEKLATACDTTPLVTERTGLERTANRALQELNQLELRITATGQVSEDEVKTAEAIVGERQLACEKAEASCAEAAADVATSESALKVLDYWNKAFSPAGIPNMILRDSVGPLNHEAQRVSAMMTGNTIGVRFDTARAKAGGDLKPELLIAVDNKLGGKKLIHNSKGENGLANFIIAETLSTVGQVGHRIGFRWFDEVVPHQDPVVCRSIYAYLRDQAHRQGILIFIVDHNPVAANYADYFLKITKRQEGKEVLSEAEWET